jgi:hypothetical protein
VLLSGKPIFFFPRNYFVEECQVVPEEANAGRRSRHIFTHVVLVEIAAMG